MAPDPVYDKHHIALLAAHAGLPLAPERVAAVATILNAWLPDANALSVRMSAPAWQSLMPAVVFMHAAEPGEEGA